MCLSVCVCVLWIDTYSLHRDDEAVKSPVDKVDRWMHDLYIEEKQGPRTEQEKERVSKC